MQHELEAWLGDTETTPEQRERLAAAADLIEARYPIPTDGTVEDVADDREQALTAAAQVILGDATPEELVGGYHDAQAATVAAHAAMTGAIIATEGTERELAARLGLARMTIRKALARP